MKVLDRLLVSVVFLSRACIRRVTADLVSFLPWANPGPLTHTTQSRSPCGGLVEAVVVLAGRMGSCKGCNLFCGYLALQSVCTPRSPSSYIQYLSQTDIYTPTHTALAPHHAACMGPRV